MKLNLNNADLKITAGLIKQFPADRIPQAAFAGKSNVGKSSLINSLLNRKNLARVSGEPGKTITVNFFDVDKKLYLVDLPGYGYAKRSFEDKKRWSALTDGYFTQNSSIDSLRVVCQLVDSRTGPTNDDCDMLYFLRESRIPHILVATKTDKLNATEMREFDECIAENELTRSLTMIKYSSKTNRGRDELWKQLINYCGI